MCIWVWVLGMGMGFFEYLGMGLGMGVGFFEYLGVGLGWGVGNPHPDPYDWVFWVQLTVLIWKI